MHLNPDNPMTDAEIGKALREYCYLDEGHETEGKGVSPIKTLRLACGGSGIR